MPAPIVAAGAAAAETTAASGAGVSTTALRAAATADAATASRAPSMFSSKALSFANEIMEKSKAAQVRQTQKASVNDVWAWHSLLTQVNAQASGLLPRFQHTIAVTVIGGPDSTLRSIWYLALATVFGRYRQSAQVGIQSGSIECTWDITGKAVAVKIYYENNGFTERLQRRALVGGKGEIRRQGLGGIGEFLAVGPSGETVGGPFISWLDGSPTAYNSNLPRPGVGQISYIGGVPVQNDSSRAAGLARTNQNFITGNTLPDDGRVITTEFKDSLDVQPPRPSYDHLSRESPYIALVANALTNPGFLPASPPENSQKEFPRGKRLYSPGHAPGIEFANRRLTVPALFPQDSGLSDSIRSESESLDGYPVLTQEQKLPDLKGVPNNGVS